MERIHIVHVIEREKHKFLVIRENYKKKVWNWGRGISIIFISK